VAEEEEEEGGFSTGGIIIILGPMVFHPCEKEPPDLGHWGGGQGIGRGGVRGMCTALLLRDQHDLHQPGADSMIRR
jgi:hypothetical protein